VRKFVPTFHPRFSDELADGETFSFGHLKGDASSIHLERCFVILACLPTASVAI
jgi:hypothetical protein